MIYCAYRISNGSYQKHRLPHATKEYCLRNFVKVFRPSWLDEIKLIVFMDNCNQETTDMIYNVLPVEKGCGWWSTVKIDGGSSAQSFNRTLDHIMKMNLGENDYIYMVEDDYLHLPKSREVLLEGLNRAHYVSLYDHPDKYINGDAGGNPHVDEGGEITRVIMTESKHWKLTNSTTMTFATRYVTLKDDEPVWRKYTSGTYPRDFDAFMELRNTKGRTLITPIPGHATHTEVAWLSPFVNWREI